MKHPYLRHLLLSQFESRFRLLKTKRRLLLDLGSINQMLFDPDLITLIKDPVLLRNVLLDILYIQMMLIKILALNSAALIEGDFDVIFSSFWSKGNLGLGNLNPRLFLENWEDWQNWEKIPPPLNLPEINLVSSELLIMIRITLNDVERRLYTGFQSEVRDKTDKEKSQKHGNVYFKLVEAQKLLLYHIEDLLTLVQRTNFLEKSDEPVIKGFILLQNRLRLSCVELLNQFRSEIEMAKGGILRPIPFSLETKTYVQNTMKWVSTFKPMPKPIPWEVMKTRYPKYDNSLTDIEIFNLESARRAGEDKILASDLDHPDDPNQPDNDDS